MATKTSRSQLILAAVVVAVLVLGFLWLRKRHEVPAPATAPVAVQKPGIDTSQAIAAGIDAIDPANEGKQVSVSGDLAAKAPATDNQLGITADAVMLLRFVEMLQWQEQCRGKECTYQQVWSPQAINSAKFREPAGHQNPGRLPFTTARYSSNDVRLGAFKVDAATLGNYRLEASLRIKPTPYKVTSAQLPSNLAISFRDFNGALYAGDPEHRKIGDVRVSYRIIPAMKVDVVGIQRGDKLIVQKSAAPGAQPMLVQPPAPSAAKGGS
jgi:transmembrane protein TMEM43